MMKTLRPEDDFEVSKYVELWAMNADNKLRIIMILFSGFQCYF